jgi:hypothetical protein
MSGTPLRTILMNCASVSLRFGSIRSGASVVATAFVPWLDR